VVDDARKAGFDLEFEDTFNGDELNEGRWIAHYLPHWSTRERAAARYEVGGGCLRLRIDADQQPWCPELDGPLRVSSLQTGLFAGSVGSTIGQHRFSPKAVVRDGPHDVRLYTPQYGLFEIRAKAIDDPQSMVALWMIGFGDEPDRTGEICICEIFGRSVTPDHAAVGVGVHPFGDRRLVDDFSAETVPIDAREFHVYQAEWTPEQVAFFVDGRRVKTVHQSPSYPMQLMLGIYEFAEDAAAESAPHAYPKQFVVDYVRGYRRIN
jgi:hypothetical protein